MWSGKYLSRIDFRVIPIILALMSISLLIVASYTQIQSSTQWFTALTRSQIQWFLIGWAVFFFFAGFDYNKLREWTWLLYPLMLIALFGLFFTDPIQRVQRWYRVPFINFGFQPSEASKLIVVIAMSWYLEKQARVSRYWSTALFAGLIVGIPFLLILKQPDLGTALILFPVSLVMFYFGDLHPTLIRTMLGIAAVALISVAIIFLEIIPHEELRPYTASFLKSYQFDRLDPNTHHQKAAAIAIALGGWTGSGWGKSEYSGHGWLPTPYTDAAFPAFGEEFGFIGLVVLMGLLYALTYFSFQVTVVAKDHFGRLLAAGISVYLAVHILVNIGMMCGLLPITGVPLPLISYGGTSILATMAALGILQSIYSRRFMF